MTSLLSVLSASTEHYSTVELSSTLELSSVAVLSSLETTLSTDDAAEEVSVSDGSPHAANRQSAHKSKHKTIRLDIISSPF